jgi:FkbM family methyltransferase
LRGDEAFVDAGAYNGDTLLEFIERSDRRFDSIFAFELDKGNFHEMETTVSKLAAEIREKITLFNLGLLDEEKDVDYEAGGSGKQSTFINMIGPASNSAKTVRLSDMLKNNKVTFIKMDIEGSELKALYGAEEIIKKQKPKLAICVYHKPEHLWEIPLYLKRIVPEYKIYLRHHTPLEYETVCYAVM